MAEHKQSIQHRSRHQRRNTFHITTKVSVKYESNLTVQINGEIEIVTVIDYQHLTEADVWQYVAFLLFVILYYSYFCPK